MTRAHNGEQSVYDVIIIGAGPSGLTAAIYTSRARLKTLVLDNSQVISQAAYAYRIENYPGFPDGISGMELVSRFRKQASEVGAEFATAAVDNISHSSAKGEKFWQVNAGDKSFKSLSVIISSGAVARKLKVAGEERLHGKGVSYCATCDGPFYKGKEIVVVGGGNTALEEAIFLTRFAKKVTIVHRRDRLRATQILQEKARLNKKIEFAWSSLVEEIKGSSMVEGMVLRNVVTDEKKVLNCEGVFVSIGYTPNTDFLKNFIHLDEKGYITADERMKTSKKGVFASGDCRNIPLKQIVTASGDGALAAYSCQQYIDEIKGTIYK
ncbi:thioredoxin-disulfide reductase [Candidatus Omnitrophota bacterium]